VAYFDRDDPDARIHRRDGRFAADPGFEAHPAVEVSWFGARDDCLWRGRRLPTETEWERAARGLDRRRHPWGDEPADARLAVVGPAHNATERGDLRPAGAGPTGVQDLLGNLREWTASAFRPTPTAPTMGAHGRSRNPGREPRRSPGRTAGDDPAPLLV
jgi:formylglycine-generating enzyme required for sulfatase activity